ncbi:MAG: acyltransferase [Acidobacteriota bacterium]|nr:acyltransferase [Acidobacteriota bacterium]
MALERTWLALRSLGFGTQRVIPSLDGLRAISIAFVLLSHLSGTRHFFNSRWLEELGELGVRIFFIISGYLITSILLEELDRKGSISLPRFYFRRMMRLFPAAYFLIAVTTALASSGFVQMAPRDTLFAVTYTMNYYEARGWPLGHLWSLGVEEQFYLLWPLLLSRLAVLKCRSLLLAIFVLGPFFHITAFYVAPAFNFLRWTDALAAGCLLAIIREELSSADGYLRLISSKWFFLVPLAAMAANYIPYAKVTQLAGETIMNLAIVVSMDWSMRNTNGLMGRFLNHPAISFIGVLSYSIYLWQQLFLNKNSDRAYCAFPLNILLALTVALISYVLIETPFLRLRRVIERT